MPPSVSDLVMYSQHFLVVYIHVYGLSGYQHCGSVFFTLGAFGLNDFFYNLFFMLEIFFQLFITIFLTENSIQ